MVVMAIEKKDELCLGGGTKLASESFSRFEPVNMASRWQMVLPLVILAPIVVVANSLASSDIWLNKQAAVTQIRPSRDYHDNSDKTNIPNVTGQDRLSTANGNASGKSSDNSRVNLNHDDDDLCNFAGASLRIAVSPQPPFVNCLQDIYGEWICNGSNVDVIRTLERKLNFRAEWLVLAAHTMAAAASTAPNLRVARQSWNNQTTANIIQGQWNSSGLASLLALVQSGRAWFSANGFVRTHERDFLNLFFSEPFDSFTIHLLLSKSVRDHDHIFVKPFSGQTWSALFLSAILIIPLFYLINTTSSYYCLQADRGLARLSLLKCLGYLIVYRKAQQHDCSLQTSFESNFSLELQQQQNNKAQAIALSPWQPTTCNKHEIKRRWTLQRRRARRAVKLRPRRGFFRFAYVVWYVVSSLTYQGGETEDLPMANSTRILIAFWWLYLIVVCSIHAGILTAILTFPRQNDFIQTLDDFLSLANDGKPEEHMRLSVDRHSELAELLSNPANLHKSPLEALMRRQPVHQVDFQRHRQRLLDEIERGQAAYLEERSAINMIITQEYFDQRPAKCQFKASKHSMDSVPMSLALSDKLSMSCQRQINKQLTRIRRSGLAQKWRRKFEPLGNDCLESVIINAGDVPKIQLNQVMLAIWLLGAALILGSILLLLEIVWLLTADTVDSSSGSETSSGCSSSLSSSGSSWKSSDSDESFQVQLGHKIAFRRERGLLRSAPIDSLHRRIRKPKLKLVSEEEGRLSRAEMRRRRRAQKVAERRARRLKRTVDLWTRLREGKIYSSALTRVSGGVRVRARRASRAIAARFGPDRHNQQSNGRTASDHPLRLVNNKVAPSLDQNRRF